MNTRFIFNRFELFSKTRIYFQMILWGLGLCIGILLALSFSKSFDYTLQPALFENPSLLFLIVATALPITAFSVVLGCRFFSLGYLLILLESVCRGFSGMYVFTVLGSGAWLIRLLLLFSSSSASVLIWWLLLRHSEYKRPSFSADVRLAAILVLVICFFDYFVIAPYLIGLSMYF